MSDDFHFEEYRALRTEVLERLKACHDLERFAAVAAAAVYAWFGNAASNSRPSCIVLLLPVLFAVFGGARTSALIRQLKALGCYLEKIESKYADAADAAVGWQRFRKNTQFGRDYTWWFWGTFVAISVVLSAVFCFAL
jgi:hypothetical protein